MRLHEEAPIGRLDPYPNLAVGPGRNCRDEPPHRDQSRDRAVERAAVDRREPERPERHPPDRGGERDQPELNHSGAGALRRRGDREPERRGERDAEKPDGGPRNRHRGARQGKAPDEPGERREPPGGSVRQGPQGWIRARRASIVAGPMPSIWSS